METELLMTDCCDEYVLITGGAGFLGSHLVRGVLADERYRELSLLIVDDLSGGFQQNLPEDPRIVFRAISIVDSEKMAAIFSEFPIRYVFHLAAYAAEGLSHFIRSFNYQNNLLGSINLINASVNAEIRHFVFTSSIAVYGAGQVPMREDTVPHPEDPYGISKFAVELDLLAAHQMFGLNFTVFRPHNVYGEFQNIGDRYRNVVGIFMNRIMQNRPLPVFGDGSQQRAFTYVGDIIPPMLQAPFEAGANAQAFNVGASQPVSVKQLATIVAEEFDVSPEIDLQPARNEVHIAWSDHSKCERVFGASQETPLRDGIRRMAQWARTVGARTSTNFDNIEIERNLPLSWRTSEK